MDSLEQLLVDHEESLEREMREGFARIDRRFDQVDQRLEAAERRLERIENSLAAIQLHTAGMSKSLAEAERIDSRMTATQMAQQQAIDDLARRVAKLEQRLEGR